MSIGWERLIRCDVCQRDPNGDSPDNVLCLSCGHDICDECGPVSVAQDDARDAQAIANRHEEIGGFER